MKIVFSEVTEGGKVTEDKIYLSAVLRAILHPSQGVEFALNDRQLRAILHLNCMYLVISKLCFYITY